MVQSKKRAQRKKEATRARDREIRSLQAALAKRTSRKEKKKAHTPCVVVSDCTRDYLAVNGDPFGSYTKGLKPCVPDRVVFPSTKLSFRMQGECQVGTNGIGAVLMNPYAPGSVPAIKYTTTGSSLTAAGAYNAGGLADATMTIPTPVLQIENEVRIVAAALRVSYIGPVLDRAGVFHVFRSGHGDDLLNTSPNVVNQQQKCVQSKNNGQWITIDWKPASANDMDYQYNPVEFFAQVINFSGAAGDNYRWDAVFFYEFTGTSQTDNTTLSHSDSVGFATAQEVIGNAKYGTSTGGLLKQFADAMLATTSYVYDNGQGIAKAISVGKAALALAA